MIRHTLANHFLEISAGRFPAKTALVHENKRLTYADIDSMANRLASALADVGVKRGDRVAVYMDNCIESVVSIFAALKANAAFVMINHTTKAEKLQYILNNSRATVLLAQDRNTDIIRRIYCPYLKAIIMTGNHTGGLFLPFGEIMNSAGRESVHAECIDLDLASILYTSGSSGYPKGVMLSHQNMVSAAHSITTYLENNENDIIINVLPLSFDYGLYQVLMGFMVGGTVILEKSFTYSYQLINSIMKEKVTGLPGVPTIFAILLQMKDIGSYDLSSLRYITNTAAALPVSHIEKLRKLVPHAKLYSMYGLTECKRVSFLPPSELDSRPTSVGKGMPNEEVSIVNQAGEKVAPGKVGELVVRGSNVMLGYWEMPEETAQCLKPGVYPGERVLYTGDLFRMDEDGYLYFISRKDDIIKSGGEKVSPKEIENILYQLEGIAEVSASGLPDAILGEAVKVDVVLEDGYVLSEKDILKYCSQHLESLMIPKLVEIRKSLPKTPNWKIRREKNQMYTNAEQFVSYASGRTSDLVLHDYLSDAAHRNPDKIGIIQGERAVTYKDLEAGVSKVAAFLMKNGMQKGDRAAVFSDNSPEYVMAYFGVQKSGGVSVDINPLSSANETRKLLKNCKPKFIIAENKFEKAVFDAVEEIESVTAVLLMSGLQKEPFQSSSMPPASDSKISLFFFEDILEDETCEVMFPRPDKHDIASIIYTSGTTGEPKGVMLSHDNLVSNAISIVDYLHLKQDDKIMVVLPFCYSYGKSVLNIHIMVGGTLVLENSFMYPNVVLNKMIEHNVTGFSGVPSTFAILLNRSAIRNYRFPSLRYVTQAGGPMSPVHAREIAEVLPGTDIYIMYGQTEASPRISYLEPRDLFRKPGSIGKAIPGVTIELIKENGKRAEKGEEGEIVVTGRNIMAGYWNNPEETKRVLRDGRLFTGDIAKMDDEGYLFIISRRNDMIKSGAHRISPKEIEEVILGLPEVHEVSVIGIEDTTLGEVIKAVVVLKEGCTLPAKKVQIHCHENLASFKVPKEVVFANELPKTPAGKVRKYLLKGALQ